MLDTDKAIQLTILYRNREILSIKNHNIISDLYSDYDKYNRLSKDQLKILDDIWNTNIDRLRKYIDARVQLQQIYEDKS